MRTAAACINTRYWEQK